MAVEWKQRESLIVPSAWTRIRNNISPMTVENGTYVIYTGVPHMSNDFDLTSDCLTMAMIYGLISRRPTST